MKNIKTYMDDGELYWYANYTQTTELEKPVTIIHGHDEPLDQSALGFFLGFIVGTFLGMAALFYVSSIPLGQ